MYSYMFTKLTEYSGKQTRLLCHENIRGSVLTWRDLIVLKTGRETLLCAICYCFTAYQVSIIVGCNLLHF